MSDWANSQVVLSAARWVGTVLAGVLISKGWATATDEVALVPAIMGAVIGLVTVGASMWSAITKKKALDVAKAVEVSPDVAAVKMVDGSTKIAVLPGATPGGPIR